ncbi:MAG: hypothetical protein CL908_03605 [Deltaproteobacteria bacterium]|nr:hypothetical protein [Deltaproteobacteria bacterium]
MSSRTPLIRVLATCCLLGPLLAATAGGQVVLDPDFSSDTVGPGQYAAGMNTDYLVRESYGRRAGDNLFHRFVRFDVPTGQSATFVEDAPGSGIRRVVSYVGGSSASRIDGVLRSTIPNADLYFYNARGVVFGPNARLDLQGAFHTGTADHIRFRDDARFGETPSGTSVTLSAADPVAWGFLSVPAAISVEGSSLIVPDDTSLALVGGPLSIAGSGSPPTRATLAAPSGSIQLVSVGSPGEVAIDASTAPDLTAFDSLAPVQLTDEAFVDASGTNDQTLILRGDSLSLDDATIFADHLGPADHPGDAIDIAVRGSIRFGDSDAGTGAFLKSTAFRDLASGGAPGPDVGDGGDVRIAADSFTLDGMGTLMIVGNECANDDCFSSNRPGGAGGALEIDVDRFAIRNGAFAVVQSVGTGTGSHATIRARQVEIGNEAGVFEDTFLLSFNVGSFTPGTGPPPGQDATGGDLTIQAEELVRIDNGGRIRTETQQNGAGGNISIETTRLELVETDPSGLAARSGILTDTVLARTSDLSGGEGTAGDIDVVARGDIVLERGFISSRARNLTSSTTDPTGATGDITLSAPTGTIDLVRSATIESQVFDGLGSTIALDARRVSVRGLSAVQSTLNGDGTAGDIRVRADDILVTGSQTSGVLTRSGLFSKPLDSSDIGSGSSGTIRIDGERLRVENGATISVSTIQTGAVGDVIIGGDAPLQSLTLDAATIEAESNRIGASGGNIQIDAQRVRLDHGARITTSNTGFGDTGTIRLNGRELRILRGSELATRAGLSGAGGDVAIRMTDSVIDHSAIRASAAGATPSNQGGNIDIDSRVLILSSARLDASAPVAAGGRIQITAGRFIRTPTSVLDATGGSPDLDGVVQILSAETNMLNAIPRPAVVFEDPTRRLASGCESRTDAQGSLHALPRVLEGPPDTASFDRARRFARLSRASDGRAAAAARLRAVEAYLEIATGAGPEVGEHERYWSEGEAAGLYLDAGRLPEALQLARRAFAAASTADDLLARYRVGRVLATTLARTGDRRAAIESLRGTARLGESLRRDRLGELPSEITRVAASPELEGEDFSLATDHLLSMLLDEVEGDVADPAQSLLQEIRDLLETQRSAELEDHFRDACLAEHGESSPDAIPGALVLYPILLDDKAAMLTGFEGRFAYHRIAIPTETLLEQTRELRQLLEKRTTRQFLRPAQELYDVMIRPFEAEITAAEVDTVVVVPDGLLRTIPFAALHDRETDRFLVDMKPVALVPSLRFTRPTPIAHEQLTILAAGLEKATAGFERLDYTRREIEELAARFPKSRVLFDDDFEIDALAGEIRTRPYSIVHVATHGRVEADGADSFLLTSDGRVGLDRMTDLISTTRFRRERPLELLTLSACETASGDGRAALGLAGVALRAGARSALATLWSVNDEATARLIDSFYEELAKPEQSRAGALRAAQLEVRGTPRFAHPGYWAPFLMISSWL